MVHQTDGEDHLKLGKFLETAEDNVHSRRTKNDCDNVRFMIVAKMLNGKLVKQDLVDLD